MAATWLMAAIMRRSEKMRTIIFMLFLEVLDFFIFFQLDEEKKERLGDFALSAFILLM